MSKFNIKNIYCTVLLKIYNEMVHLLISFLEAIGFRIMSL